MLLQMARTAIRGASKAARGFNAQAFLGAAGAAKRIVEYRRGERVFTQGAACDHVMYIQAGAVRLSVSSKTGREAVVGVLGRGDFFGEGCLAGQTVRSGSATAVVPSVILLVGKARMLRLLQDQRAMSDRFISHILARHIRIEEDLTVQLFNSNEKRLARALLLLARYGKQDKPIRLLPKVSQAALAEMAGTTRAGEVLPEQVQEARVHRRQRRSHDQLLAPERRAAGLASRVRSLSLSLACGHSARRFRGLAWKTATAYDRLSVGSAFASGFLATPTAVSALYRMCPTVPVAWPLRHVLKPTAPTLIVSTAITANVWNDSVLGTAISHTIAASGSIIATTPTVPYRIKSCFILTLFRDVDSSSGDLRPAFSKPDPRV
jgi:CRP/FNR family cyclic AMP-dependent transcriptional regulator